MVAAIMDIMGHNIAPMLETIFLYIIIMLSFVGGYLNFGKL